MSAYVCIYITLLDIYTQNVYKKSLSISVLDIIIQNKGWTAISLQSSNVILLQRIVGKRDQDSAMHEVHRQKNNEDVLPKVGLKSQFPMPFLEI